ncbi:MAG: MoaD/ThiS family protein [Deltaproteobacteria bacterium]|nr:MoaD/ThiS family protein [Deltaproteobacteria bacterium]
MQKTIKLLTNFGKSNENLKVEGTLRVREVFVSLMKDMNIEVPTEELDPLVEILLNGRDINFYSKKLDEELKDGDILEIYLTPLGGG